MPEIRSHRGLHLSEKVRSSPYIYRYRKNERTYTVGHYSRFQVSPEDS
jgi:hypothetical protein